MAKNETVVFKDSNDREIKIGDKVRLAHVYSPEKGVPSWATHETNYGGRPAEVVGFTKTRVKLFFAEAGGTHAHPEIGRTSNVVPEYVIVLDEDV